MVGSLEFCEMRHVPPEFAYASPESLNFLSPAEARRRREENSVRAWFEARRRIPRTKISYLGEA